MKAVCCALLAWPASLLAGGPLFVGSSTIGVDGQIITWDPNAMPIQYRVDGGAMSSTPGGTVVITNSAGISRVQTMFQTWQNVSTATISFTNAGSIRATSGFSDGDVSDASEYDAVSGDCAAGTETPIIFDAKGDLLTQLGVDNTSIIGFSGVCALSSGGHILSDLVLMNGRFQDGVSSPQLDTNQFNEAFIHEFGHLLGLDHSQINLDLLTSGQFGNCDTDELAGLPLMFPFAFCQARLDAGLPQLSPDDVAWISKLYPSASFATTYATISGAILFSDGQTPVQGVNVIARQVDNSSTPQDESRSIAVSVVSGFRFTSNPGQTLTAQYIPCTPPGQNGCPDSGFFDDNSAGALLGSRNLAYYGTYEIPVPSGSSYTVEVESIFDQFTGGSSVGPLDPAVVLPGGIPEFWNAQESAYDNPNAFDPISTTPGQAIGGIDIILNSTQPRFDQYEDGGAKLWNEQVVPWLGEETGLQPLEEV